MTYREAAEAMSVSVRTVRRMVHRGELEVNQAPGTVGPNGVRVSRRSVEGHIEEFLEDSMLLGPGRRRRRAS